MKRIGNTLIADDDCYLINGEEIAETLTASDGYDFSKWSEISIEEYNKRFEEPNEEEITDYVEEDSELV